VHKTEKNKMKTIDGFQINAYTPEREFLVVESNRL